MKTFIVYTRVVSYQSFNKKASTSDLKRNVIPSCEHTYNMIE